MHLRRKELGFSMLETVVVVAISLIAAGLAIMYTRDALRNEKAEMALQDTMSQLRTARQLAVDRRRVFKVTFASNPGTITVTVTPPSGSSNGCAGATSQWPDSPATANPADRLDGRYDFAYVTGAPNGASTAPDGLGAGKTAAMSFTSPTDTSSICFYPDGSARDSGNLYDSAVIYLAPTTASENNTNARLNNMRAVTIFGPTGRITGWRLSQNASGLLWKQQ